MKGRFKLSRKQIRRVLIGAALSLGVSVVLTGLFYANFLSGLQEQSHDFFYKSKRAALDPASNRAVIVGIDEKSSASPGFGRWPWPRSRHADLVRQLIPLKPRVIAFDVLLIEPSPDDDELAAAIRAAREARIPVILPSAGYPETPEKSTGLGEPIRFGGWLEPAPLLRQASGVSAHVNVLPDSDGAARRMPLPATGNGALLPSLGLSAEAFFLRRPAVFDGPPNASPLLAGARQIPVDPFGRMIINYQGPPSVENRPSTFDVVSFVDVVNGQVDPAKITDRAVFIGQMYTGADSYFSPASSAGEKMFGVEIHANVFETILRNSFLTNAGLIETIITIILLAVVGGLILPLLRPLWGTAIVIGAIIAYFYLADLAFNAGVLLNLVYPPASIIITFITMLLYRIIFEEADRRFIQNALGNYTSKAVLDAILANPSMLKLGGEKREMTVLFADIRGFTTISEGLDPQALVQLLNEYLTAMTDLVFQHSGVLDKYMGDAIMAFWGAPMDLPDHARRGCQTALDMIHELHILQRKWIEEGVPPLNIGIGLNTGPMSVGNMGSRSRFDYTVMGDAVNLGSRLEGLNKEYGTNIIISEFTETVVRTEFAVRPLDVVAVKGKKEPVAIFELMARAGELDEAKARLVEVYNQGYALYRERRWLDAKQRFDQALAIDPADGPSRLYVERCSDLAVDPPPVDWDGVYVLKHK